MNHAMTMPMNQPVGYSWLVLIVGILVLAALLRFTRLRQVSLVALMVLLPLHMLFSSDMAVGSGVAPTVAMHMDNHPCCAPRSEGSPVMAPQLTLIWVDRYASDMLIRTKLGWPNTVSNKAPPLG